MSAKGHGRCHCKAEADYLPMIMVTARGTWELKGKQMSLLSSKKARRTQGWHRMVSHTSVPGKMMEQLIMETISMYTKGKKVTGVSQCGFTKGNNVCPTWRESAKKTETGSFEQFPVTGVGAMDTRFCLNVRKHFFTDRVTESWHWLPWKAVE